MKAGTYYFWEISNHFSSDIEVELDLVVLEIFNELQSLSMTMEAGLGIVI